MKTDRLGLDFVFSLGSTAIPLYPWAFRKLCKMFSKYIRTIKKYRVVWKCLYCMNVPSCITDCTENIHPVKSSNIAIIDFDDFTYI